MSKRVILFVDEKNIYKGARNAFFPLGGHFTRGNFRPIELGQLIVERLPLGIKEERVLHQVRLYTGTPDSRKEPKGYAAHMNQVQAWT